MCFDVYRVLGSNKRRRGRRWCVHYKVIFCFLCAILCFYDPFLMFVMPFMICFMMYDLFYDPYDVRSVLVEARWMYLKGVYGAGRWVRVKYSVKSLRFRSQIQNIFEQRQLKHRPGTTFMSMTVWDVSTFCDVSTFYSLFFRCHLLILTQKTLKKALSKYPEVDKKFKSVVRQRKLRTKSVVNIDFPPEGLQKLDHDETVRLAPQEPIPDNVYIIYNI